MCNTQEEFAIDQRSSPAVGTGRGDDMGKELEYAEKPVGYVSRLGGVRIVVDISRYRWTVHVRPVRPCWSTSIVRIVTQCSSER